MKVNSRKWVRVFFSIVAGFMLFCGMFVIVVDPYFHYHAPLESVAYVIDEERYVNYGIIKNFEYDAMITGTSLTENFKTSEFDLLFGVHSIKVLLSGAKYAEIAAQMKTAIECNDNLTAILYGINCDTLMDDKDEQAYEEYPTYLYDTNIFNDYRYIFSGQALKRAGRNVARRFFGRKTTSFDAYANWNDKFTFSRETVLASYERADTKEPEDFLDEKGKIRVKENVKQNIADIVKLNKDVTFYLFLAPNSIVWWDSLSQAGELLKYLEAEKILLYALLECENVKVFSFYNKYDLICNLDNYKDTIHYSEDINSQILKWIKNGEYQITKENIEEYIEKRDQFYQNCDYDIFVSET